MEMEKQSIEQVRDRLLCILTNTPENFFECIRHITIQDTMNILEGRGILPMGTHRKFQVDGLCGEILDLLKECENE